MIAVKLINTDFLLKPCMRWITAIFFLQLYSSMDFGKKWQLVHDNVMPGRFYWYDYGNPLFLLFAVIDCNVMFITLCCQKIQWPFVKNRSPSLQSSIKVIIFISRRAEGIARFFFYSTNMTCCFCCHCHLVISTAWAQGVEYWCEPVYPCLSWYVSNQNVFFSRERKGISWRTSSPHAWTARCLVNKNSTAGMVVHETMNYLCSWKIAIHQNGISATYNFITAQICCSRYLME